MPRWREKHNLNVNFAASGLQEASSSPLRLPSFLITTSFDQLSKEGLLIVYFSLTLSRFFREFQGFEFRKIYTWNVKEILRIELSRIVKNSRNDKSDRFGSSWQLGETGCALFTGGILLLEEASRGEVERTER